MKDVEYRLIKGKWVFKALTPAAREAMGREMGGPWAMAAEVFWQNIDEDKFAGILERLESLGLKTEDEAKQWEF